MRLQVDDARVVALTVRLGPPLALKGAQSVRNHVARDLAEPRWHGITDLRVLLRDGAGELPFIWKLLHSCILSDGQRASLGRMA